MDWVDQLTEVGVPVAPIRDVIEALDEARRSGRDMVLDLADGAGATVPVLGNPVRYVGESKVRVTYPPSLGQQTDDVLRELLGFDEDIIRTLRADDVVR